MSGQMTSETTRILQAVGRGDEDAVDRLLPLVYEQLRALAGNYFRAEPSDHTLQPTALVHEVFVRMVGGTEVAWNDRAHFFALAATAMRRILADHARRRRAAKRGGDWHRVTLDAAVTPPTEPQIDAVALDSVLSRLAELDERKHRVVEMRFFGGLTIEEVAAVLGVSTTTVEGDWRVARAWLKAELERELER